MHACRANTIAKGTDLHINVILCSFISYNLQRFESNQDSLSKLILKFVICKNIYDYIKHLKENKNTCMNKFTNSAHILGNHDTVCWIDSIVFYQAGAIKF